MLSCHTASRIACASLVALLAIPATAFAATPPVLEAPAAGASSFKEGSSMTFEWRGALQGDSDTLSRSFFRLEIAKASDVPSGAQSEWSKLENFVPTTPGTAASELEVGVPTAGSYRWRVCAWGVIDDVVANEIVQLPGGCSTARAFTTVAVADTGGTVGELKIESKVTVPGRVETIEVTRPNPNATTPKPAVTPQPPAAPEPKPDPVVPVSFTDIVTREVSDVGSALGLGDADSPLAGDAASSKSADADGPGGLSGTVLDGLGASLPLIPIPFWTLALLLACLPVARLWRSSVLGMFDWNDGSIDGSGRIDDVPGHLAPVAVATDLKVGSITADADAPNGTPFAPERGRRAA